MAWTSLSERIKDKHFPVLLAGPILRRCETTNVSVWFVLRIKWKAALLIYDDKTSTQPIFSSDTLDGICIGENVFVFCITAKQPDGTTFLRDLKNYYYDIVFEDPDKITPTWLSELIDLSYDGSKRPSFSLPPSDINNVRLIHGSCRKPHGEGYDAMEGLHEMILSAVESNEINPVTRPHQLFLTGDQIYADDVADVLLYMIDDAANTLFKWNEDIYSEPFRKVNKDGVAEGIELTPNLSPGKRNENDFIREGIGFTGMISGKPENSKSHLLKFREYAIMYLFVWSDVLWPSTLPKFKDVYPRDRGTATDPRGVVGPIPNPLFKPENEHIIRFKSTLENIRKALANIPTYMIFDDHEITDDWNLNWRWCKEVYSKSLGRQTVQNGLLAYTLFQAWGNTPSQFTEPSKKLLLNAASNWRGQNDSHLGIIKTLLNIPTITLDSPTSDFPHHSGDFFDWHYEIQAEDYSVYVQDSRTWRSYWWEDISFVGLISRDGFKKQLPEVFPTKKIIFVVAPSPVIGEPFVEEIQKGETSWEKRCDSDTEAWSLNDRSFEDLFFALSFRLPEFDGKRFGRFAFLSGDVHYAVSARYQFWANGNDIQTVFAQLTASSFKNQTYGLRSLGAVVVAKGTETLHNGGYPISLLDSTFLPFSQPARKLKGIPDPIQKFVWEPFIFFNPPIGKYMVQGFGAGFLLDYNPPKEYGMIIKTVKELETVGVTELTIPPKWKARIDWMLGDNSGSIQRTNMTPTQLEIPTDLGEGIIARNLYLQNAKEHGQRYVGSWGHGKEIVGVNNLGKIRINFINPNDLTIQHIVWWRLEQNGGQSPLKCSPLTTFVIPLNLTGDKTSFNEPIIEPTFNGL